MRYVNPLTWFRWSGEFLFAWLLGLRWRGAFGAAPAVVVMLLMAAGTAAALYGSQGWRAGLAQEALSEALRQEDHAVAELMLIRLVRQSPDAPDLQLQLARTYESLGKLEESRAMYSQLALEGRNGEAALWLLKNELKPEQLSDWTPEQREQYGNLTAILVEDSPRSSKANEYRADYLVRFGAPRDAVPYLERLLESQPLRGLQVASVLKSEGDIRRANEFATRVLQRIEPLIGDEPQRSDLRMWHAQTLVFLERYGDAVKTLQQGFELSRAQDLKGPIAETLIAYSQSLQQGAAPPAAAIRIRQLKCLQIALQYAPAHPSVLRAVSDTLMATLDEEDGQIAALREALLNGSSPGLAHFIRGTAAVVKGDLQTASIELQLAAKDMPHSAAVLNNLAVAKMAAATERGDSEGLGEALLLVDKAIELAGDAPQFQNQLLYFHETRGQILLAQGDHLEAVHSLEIALAADELRIPVHQALAQAYNALGQTTLAEMHTQSADELASKVSTADDQQGDERPADVKELLKEAGRAIFPPSANDSP